MLLIDTAGRLQNKQALMDELEKVIRVLRKVDPSAPHQVLLVLDATTGQNALNQVEVFKDKAGVTGLVMTKLDGTARGGILVAISAKFGLPVHAIGVGRRRGGPCGVRRGRVCARNRAELRIAKGRGWISSKSRLKKQNVAVETMKWRQRHYPFNAEQTVNILGEIGPLCAMFLVNGIYGIAAGTWALIGTTIVSLVTDLWMLGRPPDHAVHRRRRQRHIRHADV